MTDIGLKARKILIDTSVYRQNGFNLRSRAFDEFKKAASAYSLTVHIDPVIDREIDRGLMEIATEVASKHRKLMRLQNLWNSRFGTEPDTTVMDAAKMVADARRQFDADIKRIGVARHGYGTQTVESAMNAYFERRPPFDREGSREFPDHVILEAASQAAGKFDAMYVVTKDQAMLRGAATYPNLHPVASLEAFLGIVAELMEPHVTELMERFLDDEDSRERMLFAFSDAVGEEGPIYDGWNYEEVEIDKIDVEEITVFEDFSVVSIAGDVVTLSGVLTGEGLVEGKQMVTYDEGPDRPPSEYREELSFHGKTSARVIVSFNRDSFSDVEVTIEEPYIHVSER